jgi:diguanylate cyclase (GGDEF)-like protein/PAS domain S-box-containing protein
MARELAALMQAVASHLEAPQSPQFLFHRVLESICSTLDWQAGVIWVPDEESEEDSMVCAAQWCAPGGDYGKLQAVTSAYRFGRGEGLAGHAWESREPVVMLELKRAARLSRSSLFKLANLRSGLAVPILAGEKPAGVIELLSTRFGPPEEDHLAYLTALGGQIARALHLLDAREELSSRENRRGDLSALEEAFSALEDGVVIQDNDGSVVACNPSLSRILPGLSVEEITGLHPARPQLQPEYEDGTPMTPANSPCMEVLRTGRPVRSRVIRYRRPDGETVWVAAGVQPLLREGEHKPYGIVSSFSDVTQPRISERALREERDRAQTYLDVAGTMIVVLDLEGHVTLINPKGCAVLGYQKDELLGEKFVDVVIKESDRNAMRQVYRQLRAGRLEGAEYLEGRVITKVGNERIVAWHNTLVQDGNGQVTATLSSGEDITERRRAEQISHLAYHDSLTGLPNRALLNEHMTMALARARRNGMAVALLSIDLNDFKLVNDSLGHAAGDDVLCEVARRVGESIRGTDLLARHGGDEFILLLGDIDGEPREIAETVASKIVQQLERPIELSGAEFHIGASIGIALYPEDSLDPDTLLAHADSAMYQAKAAGRNGFTVYVQGDKDALEPLSMATRLRKALENHEFALAYQPIFEIPNLALVGLEALIRWNDPERGLVLPGDFIPVAEDTGLIEPIGEWVIDALCAQVQTWNRGGLHPYVSFNVSPRQLKRLDMATMLGDKLREFGLDGGRFTMEITESAMMRRPDRAKPVFDSISDFGMRLAIDDFGAGYSSLARLLEMPVQTLKIDRSFLEQVPQSEEACAVVRAVIQLGQGLKMATVAEGVETQEQLDFLVKHGCPLAQGFFLARPLTSADATRLLRESGSNVVSYSPAA